MLIAESVDARWPLSAKVRAYCTASCAFSVGVHGPDWLGAYKFTRIDYALVAGDRVLLKVRRPYPDVGGIVDTSTVLKVDPAPL